MPIYPIKVMASRSSIGLGLCFSSAAMPRRAFFSERIVRMCSVFRTEHNNLRGVLHGVIRDQQWNCGTILRGETHK